MELLGSYINNCQPNLGVLSSLVLLYSSDRVSITIIALYKRLFGSKNVGTAPFQLGGENGVLISSPPRC